MMDEDNIMQNASLEDHLSDDTKAGRQDRDSTLH